MDGVRAATDPLINRTATVTGQRAVAVALRDNLIRSLMNEGHFVNYGRDTFAFLDPKSGRLVPGPSGAPLVFGLNDVKAAARLTVNAVTTLPGILAAPRVGYEPTSPAQLPADYNNPSAAP
jgi:hypothetical protein